MTLLSNPYVLVVDGIDFESLKWPDGRKLSTTEKEFLAILSSYFTKRRANTPWRKGQEIVINFSSFKYPSGRIMASLTKDYRKLWEILLNERDYVTSGSYSPGSYGKLYKVNKEKHGENYRLKKFPITTEKLQIKLAKYWAGIEDKRKQNNSIYTEYRHLTKWFDERRLTIDTEEAESWLAGSELNVEDYNSILWAVHEIDSGHCHLFISKKVNRFFSPLTALKRELRQWVLYEDQPLVAFDIKNSIPWFSTFVLSQEFFKEDITKKLRLKVLDSTSLSFLHNMLSKTPQLTDNEDSQNYIKLCRNGTIYEIFGERVAEVSGNKADRSQTKVIFFETIFGERNSVTTAFPGYIAFRELFPSVLKIFDQINQHKNNFLSHLLMSIESATVLDHITRAFIRSHRKGPVFTIHDSLVTTENQQEKLKQVILKTTRELFGISPLIKQEPWCTTRNSI